MKCLMLVGEGVGRSFCHNCSIIHLISILDNLDRRILNSQNLHIGSETLKTVNFTVRCLFVHVYKFIFMNTHF